MGAAPEGGAEAVAVPATVALPVAQQSASAAGAARGRESKIRTRMLVEPVFRSRRFLGAVLAGLCLAVSPAHSVPVPSPLPVLVVTGRLEALSAVPLSGFWVLRRVDGQPGELIRREIPNRGPSQIELPAGSTWEIALEAEGFWAARQVVVLGPAGGELTREVAVWPLGEVAGLLRVTAPAERLPKTLEVAVLRPAGRRSTIPEGRSGCDLAPELEGRTARFLCRLPATDLDLSFQPSDYAPEYRRAVRIASGKRLDLGELALRKGGSVVGWVEALGGKIEKDRCHARLIPATGPGGAALVRESVESAGRDFVVPPDGAFVFTGLSPGVYRLEVDHPGYARGRAAPISVFAGRETLLRESLKLQRPVPVEIDIVPPRDGFGRPWRVQLSGGPGADRPSKTGFVLNAETDSEGRAKTPNVEPGDYWLSVLDSFGGSHLSDPTFRIDGPGDFVHEVRIEIWTIEGTVRLGEQPLSAKLYFGGRHGNQRAEFWANREGEFQGVLPRLGDWSVDIEAEQPPFRVSYPAKVVPDGEGRGRVEIRLPDTRLTGRVVDEKGSPVGGAYVAVSTEKGLSDLPADDQGAFELRGLSAGRVVLAATSGRGAEQRTSDEASVVLAEGESSPPVTLVLRDGEIWQGRVESPFGPVAGATVSVVALPPGPPARGKAQSDITGAFSIRLPKTVEGAYAVLAAPGFGLKAQRFARAGASLKLAPESGTLILPAPEKSLETAPDGPPLAAELFQDGFPLSRQVLYEWAILHGGRGAPGQVLQRLPELAPGRYRFCVGSAPPVAGLGPEAWAATYARCTEGNLPAGGTLKLTPPTEQEPAN